MAAVFPAQGPPVITILVIRLIWHSSLRMKDFLVTNSHFITPQQAGMRKARPEVRAGLYAAAATKKALQVKRF